MIITGIIQTRNEQVSGHLSRFLKWNSPIIDNLIAYDDFSSDGTSEMLEAYGAEVIQGNFHSFRSELQIKERLLKRAVELFPESDWFLWLDADELLLESRERINKLLSTVGQSGFDGIQLQLVNLWRSERFFRVDSGFDALRNVRFWRNTGNLFFETQPGLHLPMHPKGLKSVTSIESPRVLHFGFSSDEYIINKFHTYQSSGQRGRNLWRLVDESTLELRPIDAYSHYLGDRFDEFQTQTNFSESVSRSNSSLLEKCYFKAEMLKCSHSPILAIFSSTPSTPEEIAHQFGEMLKMQNELGPGEIEIQFAVSQNKLAAIQYLNLNRLPYFLYPDDSEICRGNSDFEIYLQGVQNSTAKYILLIESTYSFSPGFLINMLKMAKDDLIVISNELPPRVRMRFLALLSKLSLNGRKPTNRHLFFRRENEDCISTSVLFVRGKLREILAEKDSNLVDITSSAHIEVAISDKSVKFPAKLVAHQKFAHPRVQIARHQLNSKFASNTLLITDDFNEVQKLGRKELSSVIACVTSNLNVLRILALENDIHCYLVKSTSIFPNRDLSETVNEIYTLEIWNSFLPKPKRNFRSKIVGALPANIRNALRRIKHLFHPQ